MRKAIPRSAKSRPTGLEGLGPTSDDDQGLAVLRGPPVEGVVEQRCLLGEAPRKRETGADEAHAVVGEDHLSDAVQHLEAVTDQSEVDRVRSDVGRVALDGEERLRGLAGECGERDLERFAEVTDEADVTSRDGHEGELSTTAEAGPFEDRREAQAVDELVEVIRDAHAQLVEDRVPDPSLACQAPRVRERIATTDLRGTELEDKDPLVVAPRPQQCLDEGARVGGALENDTDDGGLVVVRAGVDKLGGVDHGLIADRGRSADPKATVRRELKRMFKMPLDCATIEIGPERSAGTSTADQSATQAPTP